MAAFQRNLRSEALNLIRAANDLLQTENTILASAEECDYFRNIYRSSRDTAAQRRSEPPNIPIEVKETSKDEVSQSLPKQPETPLPPPAATVLPKAEPLPIKTPPPPVVEPLPTPATAQSTIGFAEIQKILSKVAPGFALLSDPPSDAKAKQIAQRWKTKNQSAPISLLYFHELPQQQKFLTNLATALDVISGPARLINAEGIEKENQWETFLSVTELKLIIICDYALWQMPHLLQFYREVPNQTQRFLLNKPVMLLPDLTLYLKDPQLKRSLWKALCQKIGSLA